MSSRLPLLSLALLLLLAPLAQAARPVTPPAEDVLAMLRRLETARLRGQTHVLRRELDEQALQQPADPMPRIYKAWLSLPSDTCWNELKAISALHPDNPWPHVGMGLVYIDWKLFAEARKTLEGARRAGPDFAPALWAEALLLRAEGRPEAAEALLRKALSRLEAPQFQAALGLVLASQEGHQAEARQLLARAVEAWPEQPEALEALARLAREAQDARLAAEAGERLLALKPEDAQAHRRQGEAWLALGEKEKAAQSLERFVALGGEDAASLALLARLYAELGRGPEEEQALTRLAAVASADAAPLLRLAELAEARDDAASAEARLEEASRRAPGRGDLHVRRARLLAKQERVRAALEAYRAAQAAPEARVPEADAEAAALLKRLRLPSTPASGTTEKIYGRVSLGLVALYTERLKERPELKGILKVRVRVDEGGRATAVEVVHDSLGDALLADHAYFAFLDARYPPGPSTPDFQYVFRPPRP